MEQESLKEILLDYILENSQDIITLVDLDFNYITCSRIFPRFFNLHHKSEVIGRNIKDILPEDCCSNLINKFHLVLQTREPQTSVMKLSDRYCEKTFYHVSIPFVKNSEITGILSVSKDMTQEENLKNELFKTINKLKSLLDNEKQLKAQKEIFLVTLTHDLKNPIQSQAMALKMLKDKNIDDNTKSQIIDMLLESSAGVNIMLNSIIQTYKIDNGVIELNKTYVDVKLLIQKCIDEVSILSQSKNVKLSVNVNADKIFCDETLMRRVIDNIINNAIKHALENSTINIHIYTNKKLIRFEFTNEGKPIPDSLKEHLFEKYVTGNSMTGIGLGLYFSKKVINAHNGNIFFKTNGNIAKFIFELPIENTTKSKIEW